MFRLNSILLSVIVALTCTGAAADLLFVWDGSNPEQIIQEPGESISDNIAHLEVHPRNACIWPVKKAAWNVSGDPDDAPPVWSVPSGTNGVTAYYGANMIQVSKYTQAYCNGQGCYSGYDRSELIFSGDGLYQNLSNWEWEKDYWFGWAIYIPSGDYPAPWPSGNGGWLGQWHVTCSPPTSTSQPLFMELKFDGNGMFHLQSRPNYNTVDCSAAYTTIGTYNSQSFADDSWHTVVGHVRFDKNSADGILELWLDGTQWVDLSNVRLGHVETLGESPRFGIYTGVDTDDGTPAKFYYDEVRIGDQNSSYNEVVPPSGATDTTPPNITSTTPTATLPAGTTSTPFGGTTDENSTCRFGTSISDTWADMSAMSTTGGTTHSDIVSGLSDGTTTYRYMICRDASSNESSKGTIQISVDSQYGGSTNLITLANTSFPGTADEESDGIDGCVTNIASCLIEYPDSGSGVPIITNLGVPYENIVFEFYGDADGINVSKTLDLYYSTDGQSYATLSTGNNVYGSQWYVFEFTGVTAQYIMWVVHNDIGTPIAQWGEHKLTGTGYLGAPSSPNITGGGASVRSETGIRVVR